MTLDEQIEKQRAKLEEGKKKLAALESKKKNEEIKKMELILSNYQCSSDKELEEALKDWAQKKLKENSKDENETNRIG